VGPLRTGARQLTRAGCADSRASGIALDARSTGHWARPRLDHLDIESTHAVRSNAKRSRPPQPPCESADGVLVLRADFDGESRDADGLRIKTMKAQELGSRKQVMARSLELELGERHFLAKRAPKDLGLIRIREGRNVNLGFLHHVALKARPEDYQALVERLRAKGVRHSIHGSPEAGSVYLRDPDNILIEVTTGY